MDKLSSCSHMVMTLSLFNLLTVASECKPEEILKHAEINNTSFMCLYFAGGVGMQR
jgi:hypothetical protein